MGLRVLEFIFRSVKGKQEDLVQFLVNILREEHPSYSDQKVARHVQDFLLNLMHGLAFVVVKKVSDSVGHDKLSMTFDELLEESYGISHRFIDLSIRLDYFRGFPTQEVLRLKRDTEKNAFSLHLLRQLVWYYFYVYPAEHSLRQSICSKLDIKLLPPDTHDRHARRDRSGTG